MASTYYIAANGNDSANGTSISTPWQTLAKVTATTLQPGDQFLFRRGDTFYGNIVTPEGSNSVNITYGAYGTGAKPIITGFTAVTAWTDKGGNIWESTNPVSTLSSVNVVTFNGVSTPMGRYPKGDTTYPFLPNFLTFQAHTGTGAGASSITSSQLTDGNNWMGADVIIRMNQWTFHREEITSQSGTTLNFDGIAGDLEDGWGFFIQNDLRTLTQQNDWYYNPISKKLSVYSVGMPSGVQVSTVDTLIYFYSNVPTVTSITLDNLKLTGANTNALWISGNLTYSVTNCDLSYCGFEAIMMYGGGIQNGTITGNTFDSNGASAIYSVGTVSNLTIANNSINMSAVISAILRNMYSSAGIEFSATNSLVQYNTIDNSAYCGISFNGANVQVRNNFVNHSALVRGDAAGIYTGYAGNTGKIIDGNIVFNSQGNPRGARSNDYFAMGIYIDDLGNNLSVTNNTIANCRTAGLYLHNSNNMLIQGNTIYNCGAIGTEIMWANGGISMDGNGNQFANTVYNNQVLNNKVFATNQYQYALNYYAEAGGGNEVSNFGTINSNYYVKVNSASTAIKSQQTGINGTMNLASWSFLSGKDVSSSEGPRAITDPNDLRFEYNATGTSKVVTLDQKYIDVAGTAYNTGSITLAPYSSAVLIKNGALVVPAPTLNITGGGQNITTTYTAVSATAVWASGHNGTYAWVQVSGATAAIVSPNNYITTINGLTTGSYIFRCTATQDDGQTVTADVSLTVAIPNIAPVANAGADKIIQLPTNSVTVTGSGTDSDGAIASYTWTKISGGIATIVSPSAATTAITGLTQGTYVFQLQVTDNQGAIGTSTVQVTVNPAIVPPPVVVIGGNQSVTTNRTAVSATGTYDTGRTVSYSWAQTQGATAIINSPNSSNTDITGLSSGVYRFKCTILQDDGQMSFDEVTITVSIADPPVVEGQYVLTDSNGTSHYFSDYTNLNDTSFTLSYSIEGGSWVFFHDYLPDYYFHTREQLWTVKDSTIYRHNSGKPGVYYQGTKPFFIDVVFKSDSDLLLETVDWVTENLRSSIDSSDNDSEWSTFTHISIWNSQQHSGRIALRDLPAPDRPYRRTQGTWTFNDFRNVLADRGVQFLLDIFHDYALDTAKTARKGFYDQEMLEDKYFVVRFEFDNTSGRQLLLHQTNIQAIKSDR